MVVVGVRFKILLGGREMRAEHSASIFSGILERLVTH
jgi:hypothetical protein